MRTRVGIVGIGGLCLILGIAEVEANTICFDPISIDQVGFTQTAYDAQTLPAQYGPAASMLQTSSRGAFMGYESVSIATGEVEWQKNGIYTWGLSNPDALQAAGLLVFDKDGNGFVKLVSAQGYFGGTTAADVQAVSGWMMLSRQAPPSDNRDDGSLGGDGTTREDGGLADREITSYRPLIQWEMADASGQFQRAYTSQVDLYDITFVGYETTDEYKGMLAQYQGEIQTAVDDANKAMGTSYDAEGLVLAYEMAIDNGDTDLAGQLAPYYAAIVSAEAQISALEASANAQVAQYNSYVMADLSLGFYDAYDAGSLMANGVLSASISRAEKTGFEQFNVYTGIDLDVDIIEKRTPEPTALALLLVGGSLAAIRRRRHA